MQNKIFTGFLVLVFSALLWLIPISSLVYTFRTDVTTNVFYKTTGAGVTSTNVTLSDFIYDNNTASLKVLSNLNTDVPNFVSYNSTTRATLFNGLSGNASRTLTVSYDTDAMDSTAWDTVLNLFPKLWLVFIICFPLICMVAIVVDKFVIKRKRA